MTLLHEDAVVTWREPESIPVRGTLIVLPGRGESPAVYERFGRRLAADSYRVHAVPAPTDDPARTDGLLAPLFADADPALPRVLVGSDAGALHAAGLVAAARFAGLSGLILAGLPTAGAFAPAPAPAPEWAGELEARTSCPTHRGRIADGRVRPGELYGDLPVAWFEAASPRRVDVPVLGLHGAADTVSPLGGVRSWYAAAPRAELVSISGGRHDALNDQTHRTVAATVVVFLERLRAGADLDPIAVLEPLATAGASAGA